MFFPDLEARAKEFAKTARWEKEEIDDYDRTEIIIN